MRLIFKIEQKILDKTFSDVADHFKTDVHQDDAELLYVRVKSEKLFIAQQNTNGETQVHVWGAKDQHLQYFKGILGEPLAIVEEKPSPLQFAQDLASIPDVQELTKEEIIQYMDITEQDITKYKKHVGFACRKSNPEKELLLAKEVLEKLE